ncbi:MAG TPA: response regulator [Ignavibacteriaceae bacterium]|jgi:sigma-B regulation protein RsbU (phosphoserine phosphatase)|nr:response regulator [Ignavibacteriaceae bacterium]
MEKDKVLIVEDDPDTRFILKRSLEKSNYEVETTENGKVALKKLETFFPKVIIADWTMPEMDGLELCQVLKDDPRYKLIYFIILTARSSLKDRVTGLDFGADDFLIKPVETQELLARIRSGVRIHNLQSELKQVEHKKAVIELACTIGHQINNPLSSLILTLENFIQEVNKEEHKEDIMIIRQSVDRIKNLVNTLINIENPEIVKYAGEKQMLNLNKEKQINR